AARRWTASTASGAAGRDPGCNVGPTRSECFGRDTPSRHPRWVNQPGDSPTWRDAPAGVALQTRPDARRVARKERGMARRREPTGWVGWAMFACVMMILVGGFNIIYGLVGIFDDQRLVPVHHGLLVFDTTTWGWILLITGLVQVFAALAVFN